MRKYLTAYLVERPLELILRNLKYKEKNLGLDFYTVKIFVGS